MRSNHGAISDCETKLCSEYLLVFEVMSSLLDQINEAKGKIQCLLDGKGELTRKEELLVASLEKAV